VNKTEFINVFAKNTETSKKQAAEMLEHFFQTIEEALKTNDEIKFIGFGTFKISKIKGKIVTNPQNKQKMEVGPYNKLRFVPGQALKNAINGVSKKDQK
jgi:DNA-binding protein HU-beta